MKERLLKLLAVVLAGILTGIAAYYGWKALRQEKEYQEGDKVYEEVAQTVTWRDIYEEGPLQNGSFAAAPFSGLKGKRNRVSVENWPQFSRFLHNKADPGLRTSAKC